MEPTPLELALHELKFATQKIASFEETKTPVLLARKYINIVRANLAEDIIQRMASRYYLLHLNGNVSEEDKEKEVADRLVDLELLHFGARHLDRKVGC